MDLSPDEAWVQHVRAAHHFENRHQLARAGRYWQYGVRCAPSMRRLETARLKIDMWQRSALLLPDNRDDRCLLLPSRRRNAHAPSCAAGRSRADADVGAVDRYIHGPGCTRPARTGGRFAGQQFHLDVCAICPIATLRLAGLTLSLSTAARQRLVCVGAMLPCALPFRQSISLVAFVTSRPGMKKGLHHDNRTRASRPFASR